MKTMNVIVSNTEENVVPNRILIFSPQTAAILLNEKIGWGRFDFPRNKTEQGGWMIGHHITNGQGEIIKSEVQYILEAETDVREPGYIEWSALEDIRLQRAFFTIQRSVAETDPEAAKHLELLGWWHTHPDRLHVFLSGTDRATIQSKFNKPGHYSVVLNPHQKIWRVFAGPDATEIHGFIPLPDATVTNKAVKDKKHNRGKWNKRKRKISMKKQKRRR